MRKILVFLSACLLSVSAWAVMATPEPIVKVQADGSEVTLQLKGDEFHSYYTRMDGTPVRMDKQGMWINDASVVTPSASARKARRIAQQQQCAATFPLSGSPHSVVILVNFTDQKFQYKQADFEKIVVSNPQAGRAYALELGADGKTVSVTVTVAEPVFTLLE